ncbi:hypothetical protein HY041_02750, partial [Candidatus Roizmanbacteria bacterium]|nr:hypothetical protein [Candidatus Roizmanbacteria bacterium]
MQKKTKDIQYYEAIGRRKQSVARVRLYLATKDKEATVGDIKIKAGEIYLNGNPIEKTFSSLFEKESYNFPL